MKYTKKHLNAVRERLLEYEFTIESGDLAMGGCSICASIGFDDNCKRDCCLDGCCPSYIQHLLTIHRRNLECNNTSFKKQLFINRYEEIKRHLIKIDVWRLL